MPIVRTLARSAAIILLGSQALLTGLAPAAFAAGEGGLKAMRSPGLAARPSDAARALATRRAALWRGFPHRVGRDPSSRPYVSGGRGPLLSVSNGKLARTIAFTGTPDTVRVLGLRIDFATDELGSLTSTPDGRFDMRDGKSLGIVIDPPPHDRRYFLSHLEALSRYWKFTSHGNLVVQYDVYPHADGAAYRLRDTGEYGPWTLGQASYDEAQRFFRDAVSAADQTDSIPFGNFDVVALFHAGADYQSDINGDSPRDFPTFQIDLQDSVPVNGGALSVNGGLVMPETENQDGYFGAINGTLAHEFGHTQGLLDLYDIETFLPGVGVWSNMDSGYLLGTQVQDQVSGAVVDATGIIPVSLDPWSKSLLWADRIQYVDPGRSLDTSLKAIELDDRTLFVPLGGEEYYLIENRETDLNGDYSLYLDRDSTKQVILGPGLASGGTDTVGDKEWDFLLPGQGILIWHVDESVLYGRHQNADLGVNTNPARRGVRLLEADATADLGDPTSPYLFGSPFDPYFVGNHTLLGPTTNPPSTTNDGGVSHITVEVKSVAGVDMDLTVSGDWRVNGWPTASGMSQYGARPTYGSLLHDGNRQVVTAIDSLVLAYTSSGEPYYTSGQDSVLFKLPSRVIGPALFADSLFHRNPAAAHGAAVVATDENGDVHAFRAAPRNSGASLPLFGWPPALDAASPLVHATTAPVLDPTGSVLVGASDGRVFVIVPSDSLNAAPRVSAMSDTLLAGGTAIVEPVTGNLAVGRFTGAGGYQVVYALRNGSIRVTDGAGKGLGLINRSWYVPSSNFRPYLLGVDMDRASDRDLEIVAADPLAGLIHCFRLDGIELSGWPVTVAGTLAGPIATGDLDGDGYPEIFAQDAEGRVHRYNRNGAEPQGWPASMTTRYGIEAVGGSGSPLVADVDGNGLAEVVVSLDNGLIVALDAAGRTIAGWPLAIQGGASSTPLILSLDDAANTPTPPGPAWTHLVIGGDDDGALNAFQLPARADSALFTIDGVSARTPWAEFGGNRRHTSVLEDVYQGSVRSIAVALDENSVYCFPNPSRGPDVGVAYTLGQGVTSVEIRVLDPMGNEVSRVAGPTGPAQNVVRIPVTNLASGVYVVRVEVVGPGGGVAFHKFAVVK